jgi:hypothetical protein
VTSAPFSAGGGKAALPWGIAAAMDPETNFRATMCVCPDNYGDDWVN